MESGVREFHLVRDFTESSRKRDQKLQVASQICPRSEVFPASDVLSLEFA
jgi:hypothetical protein